MKKQILISPSILAGDFAHLADEVKRVEEAGADWLHVDVMDGHFVKNLTLGPRIVSAINRSTSLFLDVHLMIYNPFEYIERFIEAGADMITFHFEATEDVEDTLNYIRKCNVRAGLAFCPETSMEMVPKYLDKCDMILMMSVHPGFSGQAFMPEVLEKVRFVRKCCETRSIKQGGVIAEGPKGKDLAPFDIQMDGGVNDKTAPLCIEAGANILVSGTYLFKAKDMAKAIDGLRTYPTNAI